MLVFGTKQDIVHINPKNNVMKKFCIRCFRKNMPNMKQTTSFYVVLFDEVMSDIYITHRINIQSSVIDLANGSIFGYHFF